jgi:acetyltransferase-like isoleucine patch superfamily enzyme
MIDDTVFILNPENVNIDRTARIDWMVKIEGGLGVKIGRYVHIQSFSHINLGGGSLIFGDHSGCSSGVKICSGMPDLSYVDISAAEDPENKHPIRFHTVIGKYVVIFANAVITPGVTLGHGSVVGAGAVVTKDIPDGEIWAGVPARRIGIRTFDHERDYWERFQKFEEYHRSLLLADPVS